MPTDERVERVARELHAIEEERYDLVPWDMMPREHRAMYRYDAARILRVADAPQIPDEAVGGLMEGIERTGGGA